MSLVIYSNHDIDELDDIFNEADFKNIKNKDIVAPSMKSYGKPFKDDNLANVF